MRTSTPAGVVSVVIPVRDGAATIGDQLEALGDQASECHEVVVVDNGSTDETLAVVERFRDRMPNLRVVDAHAVRGMANVRNFAMACTVGDLLCCDADDVVAPGWVRAMTAALDDDDIVGGRVDEQRLNGPSARPRTAQSTGLPTPWEHHPYAIGANMAIRREVIDHIGGWNARYSDAGEDIDLCWRAIRAGYRIGFTPDALVYYRHRTEMGALRNQQIRYGRAAAKLHHDHRRFGLPRGPIGGAARLYAKPVVLAPLALVRPSVRPDFHRVAGYAWGTTIGMFVERAWPH